MCGCLGVRVVCIMCGWSGCVCGCGCVSLRPVSFTKCASSNYTMEQTPHIHTDLMHVTLPLEITASNMEF